MKQFSITHVNTESGVVRNMEMVVGGVMGNGDTDGVTRNGGSRVGIVERS